MRAIPALLLAFATACIDDSDPTNADEEPILGDDDPVVQQLAPDPSTVVGNGWCYQNKLWNGIAARVYYPSNGGCSASVYSPLVVMVKGYGFSHLDYHYLLRHLAKNGYIGVSIDVVPNGVTYAAYQTAADTAWSFVTGYMWTQWDKRFYINPDQVALIGHSRGGEVVRFLANTLANDPVFDVRAVIPLAPTHHHNVPLAGQQTTAAMILVGAHDADTSARRGYWAHDLAGTDASQQDPFINPSALYRSMKMMHGVGHGGFAEETTDQAKATQGYVLAFLHAHTKNDVTYYEDYIRGDAIPNGLPDGVTSQYSDGFLRRVVDHFDDGSLANPTIGGGISIPLGGVGTVTNLATSNDSPHYTYAHLYTPPGSGAGARWGIPAGKRDATAFKYLSLRAGQTAGPATDDLRIRITNGATPSPWIRVTDHGVLAQPVLMCTQPASDFCGAPLQPQHHMGTIRIPLDTFGAHDDVTAVELSATNEALQGAFLIDNLEFSEWIWKP